MTMSTHTFDAVVGVLHNQFHIDQSQLRPETPLHAIGLDSLSLMEFVFAVEDHFSLRIPEERLDPRQTELTLGDVCKALDDAMVVAPRAAAMAA